LLGKIEKMNDSFRGIYLINMNSAIGQSGTVVTGGYLEVYFGMKGTHFKPIKITERRVVLSATAK
jgi:hypothetical protein